MKRKKSSDFDKISHLIPLRVTEDLTVDEVKAVDETARYDEQSRSELDAFTKSLSILHEAASTPLPEESSVVRGEGSLWDRIEPQLGPAGKRRPQVSDWMPTRYLAAACVGLLCLTGLSEFRRFAPDMGGGLGQRPVQTVNLPELTTVNGNQQAVAPQGIPIQIHVSLPIAGESIIVTELGIVVTRIERLMQHKLGLPDQNGVVITHVVPHSWADKAGLKPGDCITAIDGKSVYAPKHTVEVLNSEMHDEVGNFSLIRNRQKVEVTVHCKKKLNDEGTPVPMESSLVPQLPFQFSGSQENWVEDVSFDSIRV